MSYRREDHEKDKKFCLLDRVKARWKRVARALKFPEYDIDTAEAKGDEAAGWIFKVWLRGGNMEEDDRPITWNTLITALKEANMGGEVDILDTYLVERPVAPSKFVFAG